MRFPLLKFYTTVHITQKIKQLNLLRILIFPPSPFAAAPESPAAFLPRPLVAAIMSFEINVLGGWSRHWNHEENTSLLL